MLYMVQGMNRKMMQRCLQLAKNGLGTTYPNPLVGSVITVDNKIIAEGWHYKSGMPHAEVNAINAVKDSTILKDATLYVNLEPCIHFGKTPPCSHKIVELGIPKVVVGSRDYASHVNGQGIDYLKNHGVEVVEKILQEESYELNKRFFTFHQKKRPYIILKWAETVDGYFAPLDKTQKWITGHFSKQLVHLWRTQEQAILIGGETLRIDDPQLNARLWKGNNPIKVIVSNQIQPGSSYQVLKGNRTIIINHHTLKTRDNVSWIKINKQEDMIPQILSVLHKEGIQSIIIEGGKSILEQFIASNLWDEARVLNGSTPWNAGIKAPVLSNHKNRLQQRVGTDIYTLYQNETL
ncbi:MAG: bifunctional diaminohydroxyphosphoribosylaminopyrimidine deaminase/5-amino-6-(5-phosphoribosylamino)uracil reductase RibD [Weeksellaceae bacterium]